MPLPVEPTAQTAIGVTHESQSRGVSKLLLQTAPLLFTQTSHESESEPGYDCDEHSNSVIWWTIDFCELQVYSFRFVMIMVHTFFFLFKNTLLKTSVLYLSTPSNVAYNTYCSIRNWNMVVIMGFFTFSPLLATLHIQLCDVYLVELERVIFCTSRGCPYLIRLLPVEIKIRSKSVRISDILFAV